MDSSPPILEFDPTREALIEPSKVIARLDIPARAVVCILDEVIASLLASGRARKIASLHSGMGEHPILELEHQGHRLAVFHPGVGAPLAAGMLEEVIALGADRFVLSGCAGVVDPEVVRGHLIVPTAAVRDEGTSYHYLAPSRTVAPSPEAVSAIESALRRRNVPYRCATTWTTDAVYRETRPRIARRRAEGCATVEMEAAALFAVARFRRVSLGAILLGGDDVSADRWDRLGLGDHATTREQLFWLAAEACLAMR
jgi:uridine phosphorylase